MTGRAWPLIRRARREDEICAPCQLERHGDCAGEVSRLRGVVAWSVVLVAEMPCACPVCMVAKVEVRP